MLVLFLFCRSKYVYKSIKLGCRGTIIIKSLIPSVGLSYGKKWVGKECPWNNSDHQNRVRGYRTLSSSANHFILALEWDKDVFYHRHHRAGLCLRRGFTWSLQRQLEDLDYAHDICILSHKISNVQAKLEELERLERHVGLEINIKKAKGQPVENVDISWYIGY